MDYQILIVYSVVSFFYIISPGPAIFLAITNGMTADMKIVAMSSLGNILGLFLLSAVSISGLGALLLASSALFAVTKLVGAAYLIYLGVKQLRNGKHGLTADFDASAKKARSSFSYFKEGFFLASTNPKPILFFTALFPQFLNLKISVLPQFFVMTVIFMFFSFISLCSYGYVSKSAGMFINNRKNIVWFHRITGGIFITMGLGILRLKRIQQ